MRKQLPISHDLDVVRRVMQRKGITQSALAAMMGVERSTLTKWLSGGREISVADFKRLLFHLGAKAYRMKIAE